MGIEHVESGQAGGQSGEAHKHSEYTIRGGYVLSVDPEIGGIADGDVHVRDGRIVDVGRGLPDVGHVVDARDRIVMPGFVDTHWHLWNSLLKSKTRGIAGAEFSSYFSAKADYGPHYRPVDSYNGVRLALAEALMNGMTTVLNFNDNAISVEHVDAELAAHHEMGVRVLYAFGTAEGHADHPIPEAAVRTILDKWFGAGADTRVVYGLAIAPGRALVEDAELARRLGVPIIVHRITGLLDEGLLGPDVKTGHSYRATVGQIASAHAVGVQFSTSPTVESCIGPEFYSNAIQAFRTSGSLAMSVDSSAVNTGDVFGAMRAMLASSVGVEASEFAPFTAEEIVQVATLGGATFHGIADETGSITPGKRADILLLRSDDANMGPFVGGSVAEACDAVVYKGTSRNVDTVIVDGRVLGEGGRLTQSNLSQIVGAARQTLTYVSEQATQNGRDQ